MVKPSLFRTYVLLSIMITGCLIYIGVVSGRYLSHLQQDKLTPPNSPIFISRILDQSEPVDHIKGFEKVAKAIDENSSYDIWLIDQNGQILKSRKGRPLPFDWSKITPPQTSYVFQSLIKEKADNKNAPLLGLVKLQGPDINYMAFEFKPRTTGRPPEFWLFQSSLFISIIMASLLTFGAISLHLRRKVQLAESVMKQMQEGNLKARFPVMKQDEIGRFMLLFNKMGDDIERLVEQTKKNEQSRLFILQELTHDLRTPISSLRSMLENLADSGDNMSKPLREELLQMSLEEVHYFTRLVDDLLLLAKVLEPQYHFPLQRTFWYDLLQDEVEKLNLQQSTQESPRKIRIVTTDDVSALAVPGDEHLLRRVFRNALQNALTFAKQNVTVTVSSKPDKTLEFIVRDDGPGFDTQTLATFGERRVSRFINSQNGPHLSVGLGSVIIKKVVTAHQGKVVARNCYNDDGRISGAEIVLILPIIEGPEQA